MSPTDENRPEGVTRNQADLGETGGDIVRSWVGEVAPTVADKAGSFIFDELYSLKQLPIRYRELLIAAIIATTGGPPGAVGLHIDSAIQEGATPGEVDEMFAMTAAYAGFPKAIAAAREYQRQREAS